MSTTEETKLRLDWKDDPYGKVAVVNDWLTLSVSRCGQEWFATVAGLRLSTVTSSRAQAVNLRNRNAAVFATADEAQEAAEAWALELIDGARRELGE